MMNNAKLKKHEECKILRHNGGECYALEKRYLLIKKKLENKKSCWISILIKLSSSLNDGF